ncbi:hypothetical protein AOG2_10000 [Geobacter sp. AOG2]|nr:hypothetical protein AOG2_10000 [Geobacter sp. AOG2]
MPPMKGPCLLMALYIASVVYYHTGRVQTGGLLRIWLKSEAPVADEEM